MIRASPQDIVPRNVLSNSSTPRKTRSPVPRPTAGRESGAGQTPVPTKAPFDSTSDASVYHRYMRPSLPLHGRHGAMRCRASNIDRRASVHARPRRPEPSNPPWRSLSDGEGRKEKGEKRTAKREQ
jgi:hypothetical protein